MLLSKVSQNITLSKKQRHGESHVNSNVKFTSQTEILSKKCLLPTNRKQTGAEKILRFF